MTRISIDLHPAVMPFVKLLEDDTKAIVFPTGVAALCSDELYTRTLEGVGDMWRDAVYCMGEVYEEL